MVAALVALGCERSPGEPPTDPPRSVEGGVAARPDAALPEAGSAQALAEIRSGTLRVAPARTPAQVLALGRGRLARVTATGVEVHDLRVDAGASMEAPLAGARRVVALPDGALLALGRDASLWFDARGKAPVTVGRVSLFPEAVVHPDLADATRVWVAPGFGTALYEYALDPRRGALHLAGDLPLELADHDGRVLGATRDGTLLYSTAEGLFRRGGRGRPARLVLEGLELGAILRVLPTTRVDRAVFVHADGRAVLAQVAPSFRALRTVALPGDVRDVASGGERLAVVHVEQGKGRPRVWHLAVIHLDGPGRLDVALGEDGPDLASDDWEARVTADRNVVVSADGALVAVGGRGAVRVWSTESGALVASR
ncbi:MAG: hypothetical protein IT376_03635 [Polyangiaceae bacterium]|nr:hypothetical protein [Polyangiaceae bacterium]